MPRVTRPMAPIALLALAGAALGCPEEPDAPGKSPTEEPPAEAPPAQKTGTDRDPPPDGGDGDGEGEGEPKGQALEVLVKESTLLGNVPTTKDAPGLHTRLELEQVAVLIERLDADCGPVPSFEARARDGVIEVRLQPAEEDTGCVGPHDVKLRLDVPSGPVERLRLLDPDGKELVAGPVEPAE